MNIISIDFSKFKTGIFTKISGVENSFSIKNKKTISQNDALINIHETIKTFISQNKIDLGFIEGYGFNPSNKTSIVPMCEISGVIRLAFAIEKIPLIMIPIQTWKSLTINVKGKEKNLKNYLNLVREKYGKNFTNSDEADAYMIYKAAKIIAKKTSRLAKSQKKIKEELSQALESINGK